MPIITAQRKRQQKLIYVAILVIFVTAAVGYMSIQRGSVPGVGTAKDESEKFFRTTLEIRLNKDILKDERFLKLVPYEKLPTEIDTGRRNPFLPY